MNVLWMKSDYPLPLDSGSKKRTYNLLKHTRAAFNTTYLGTVHDRRLLTRPSLDGLVDKEITIFRERERREGFSFYLRLLANVGSSVPYFVKSQTYRELRDKRRKIFRDQAIDLVICDSLAVAGNVDFSLPVPKVFMAYGIETDLWQQRYDTAHGLIRRAYFNYETKRIAAYESSSCNRFDLVVAVSERDKRHLEEDLKVRVPIEVIETGLDCRFFSPIPEITRIPKRLVFTGSGDMLSNIDGLLWFAAEALPVIRKAHPDVTLDIIGPDPASEIRALGRKDDAIRVTGWVDDVRPYLAAADVFIVPLRVPGGTRVKVYEAMGMKTPVVSTGHGIEGLAVADGVHCLIGETPRDMAASIIELFDDAEKKQTIADNAHRFINENYDWSVMAEKLIGICKGIAAKPNAG